MINDITTIHVAGQKLSVTENPELAVTNPISSVEQRIIQRLHPNVISGKGNESELKRYIKRFPANLQFKNFLVVHYNKQGMVDKALEYNRQILEEHPDYLFAKTNLVREYVQKKQFEKVPEVLGKDFNLQKLYPNRRVFHVTELFTFYVTLVNYYLETDQAEKAEEIAEDLHELGDDYPKNQALAQLILAHRMKSGLNVFKEAQEKKVTYESKGYDVSIQTQIAPTFHHTAIQQLYQHKETIPAEIIHQIFDLPRATLIEDLEKVLKDTVHRYEYFLEETNQNGYDENKLYFPFHALFLLTELRSYKSLPQVWYILQQGSDLLGFYFGDIPTEVFFEPLYVLSQQNLETIRPLLLECGTYDYSRLHISNLAAEIVLHQPERRNEVVQWFREIIHYFIDHQDKEGLISSDLISLMICNIVDFRGIELLPEIKSLYQAGIVSTFVAGKYENVEEDLHAPKYPDSFSRYILTKDIFERYQVHGNIKGKSKEPIPTPAAELFPPKPSKKKKKDFAMPKFLDKAMMRMFGGMEEEEEVKSLPQKSAVKKERKYRVDKSKKRTGGKGKKRRGRKRK